MYDQEFELQINWTEDVPVVVRSYVEQICAAWQDFAFGYDVEEQAMDRISETLDELGIEHTIIVKEVI